MSKGDRRRQAEIPLEETNLHWDIVFAKTEEEKKLAKLALTEYFEKRKSAYIEK